MSAVYVVSGVIVGASMAIQGQDLTKPWFLMSMFAVVVIAIVAANERR